MSGKARPNSPQSLRSSRRRRARSNYYTAVLLVSLMVSSAGSSNASSTVAPSARGASTHQVGRLAEAVPSVATPLVSDTNGAGVSVNGGVTSIDPTADARVAESAALDKLQGEFSLVTPRSDGSYQVQIGSSRLNYLSGGTWRPIDVHLTPDATAPDALRTVANDLQFRAGTANAEDAGAELSIGPYAVSLRAFGYRAADEAPELSKRADARPTDLLTMVQYRGDGVGRLQFIPTTEGFEFRAVLDDSHRSAVYNFALDVGSLAPTLNPDDSITLSAITHSEGSTDVESVGRIGAPVVTDGRGSSAPDGTVSVHLVMQGDANLPADVSTSDAAALRDGEVLLSYSAPSRSICFTAADCARIN